MIKNRKCRTIQLVLTSVFHFEGLFDILAGWCRSLLALNQSLMSTTVIVSALNSHKSTDKVINKVSLGTHAMNLFTDSGTCSSRHTRVLIKLIL